MIKRLLVLLILFLTTAPAFSEEVDTAWVRRYKGPADLGDLGNALAVDASGNAYLTGYYRITDALQGYLTIKYLPNGDTAWVRISNPEEEGSASAIAVDNSGKVYVTGLGFSIATHVDYVTIKYLSNGDAAWVKTYGYVDRDYANDLAVDSSGNVYVTGYSETWWTGEAYDYATIKYLPNGDTAWVRRYNGPGNAADEAKALAVDGSGNVYVTGFSDRTGAGASSYDYVTIKYLPNGDTAWVRSYVSAGMDVASDLAVDTSGNVYVTGNGSYEFLTIKYLPNGDTAWVSRYTGPGNTWDEARALAVDGSGNVYVTGYSLRNESWDGMDFATIKYLPNGDTAWVRRYNGPVDSTDLAEDVAVDGSGNVYVTGSSRGTLYDCVTIKYLPNGDTAWVRRYNGPENSNDNGKALAVDASGNVYVTGNSAGYCLTIKYGQITGVAGTVKDALTQENLQDVLVEVLQSGIVKGSDSTNIDGQYKIINLTPGTYDIRASKSGYVTQIQTGKQITAGQTTIVDFQLTLLLEPLGDTALFFFAYSPVDLIVTDPNSDSIGISFNTIPNAVYDTTIDRNHDGDKDDIVTIPNPLVGDYLVRVVAEPGADTGHYSLGIKMIRSSETIVITNAEVPLPGQPDTIVYDVMEYLPGDANCDGKRTVSDVIFLVNYLFKGGPAPSPLSIGDANCCKEGDGSCTVVKLSVADVIYLVNYLFKGGSAPCS
jgi:uncharacterized delta-60 repeat protein